MRERVKLRVPWWGQAAAEKQMRITLEDIYSAARERGNGNPAGVARVRKKWRVRLWIAKVEVESQEYWCAGTETGDAQVG